MTRLDAQVHSKPRLLCLTEVQRSTQSGQILAVALTLGVAVSAWSPSASASRAYAYALSSGFGFGGGCPACHDNQVGGLGTANTPFGATMRSLGLGPNDVGSLYTALTSLQTSNLDSDGDTVSDFDELSPEGDPNDPAVYPQDATPVPAPTPTTTASASSGTTQPPVTTEPPSSSGPPAPTATGATPLTTPSTSAPGSMSSPSPSVEPTSAAPSPSAAASNDGCSMRRGTTRSTVVWLALLVGAVVARRNRSFRRPAPFTPLA